ncbi:MAG: winged helix-turn-helix domain-containing protein [Candidatus Acidiferrales bacterium]
MAETKAKGRTFRFGIFEMDEDTGALRKEGRAQPRLREQAARILLMLLERPRDLVAREELRERLWASDTFVDFDHGVNTAINQLRNALGDEVANPRFIQTLPRRGYRFIAPVEIAAGIAAAQSPVTIAEGEVKAPVAHDGDFAAADAEARRSSVLSDARDLPAVSSGVARTLFLLIQLIYLIFYVLSLARIREVDLLLREAGEPARLILVVLIATAAAGIPTRLYLITATAFNYRGLGGKFRRLFPVLLPLDELWALAPFLAVEQIGIGAAIAVTAALLYLPFAQRSLLLMGREA